MKLRQIFNLLRNIIIDYQSELYKKHKKQNNLKIYSAHLLCKYFVIATKRSKLEKRLTPISIHFELNNKQNKKWHKTFKYHINFQHIALFHVVKIA